MSLLKGSTISRNIFESVITVPETIIYPEENLSESEKELKNFFQFILIDSYKAKQIITKPEDNMIDIDSSETKLFINYYNIIQAEVYVDLKCSVDEIISKIFAQIFCPYITKKRYKRTKSEQTTEYIISHPIKEFDEEKSFYIYKNFLYLEKEGKTLDELIKNSNTILKNDVTLNLKLIPEFYEDIITFPKSGNIKIKLNSQPFGNFSISEKMNYEKFKKIINLSYFQEINNSENYPNLEFNIRQNICGGYIGIINGPKVFVDPSNSKLKQIKLCKNPPKWRLVKRGLNIFGKCENPKCQAFKKEVIYITYKNNEINLPEEGMIFDMITELNKIKCPICGKIFYPVTCGFYKCEYQFIGDKIKEREEVHYDSETRETNQNDIEYYIPKKENKAEWFKLKIYVLPFQKIKYNSA